MLDSLTSKNVRYFPVHSERPDETFVELWKMHTTDTGHPELFETVSTARPYDMEGVVILSGEIDVPIHKREDQALVPCPLCSPNSPKFQTGRMAWFPAEKTTLFIGHRCAKRHMGEEYEEADRRYRKETKARSILDIWGEVQERAPKLLSIGVEMLPIALAIENARNALVRDAAEWVNHVSGELYISGGRVTTTVDSGLKDGQGRRFYETVVVGTIGGRQFLDAVQPHKRLKDILQNISGVDQPMPAWEVGSGNDFDIEEVLNRGQKTISAIKRMKAVRDYLEDARHFLQPNNLKLFEQWGELENSPFEELHFRRRGSWVFLESVSFLGHFSSSFKISDDIFKPLPAAPNSLFSLRGFGNAGTEITDD